MYIRVDNTESEAVNGFQYRNQDGEEESVEIDIYSSGETVALALANEPMVYVYTKDIPNLILALQKAYEKLGGDDV